MGSTIRPVLDKLNWFCRDIRRSEATHMDPKLFDVIWEVYRESGSRQPIEVMSAYRSPETNAMLRRRSRGVAEHSQHILGKAMDQHYVDVPMSRIREIAMRLQRGGVGFYPTAGTPFVHMDVGGVRHWPRMSYDQLARLFPDGKTVHIPSNGKPLPGYEEARAELEARGDSFDYPTAGEVQSKSKGFFAWLFGGGDDEGDAAESAGQRSTQPSRRAVASLDRARSARSPRPPSCRTARMPACMVSRSTRNRRRHPRRPSRLPVDVGVHRSPRCRRADLRLPKRSGSWPRRCSAAKSRPRRRQSARWPLRRRPPRRRPSLRKPAAMPRLAPRHNGLPPLTPPTSPSRVSRPCRRPSLSPKRTRPCRRVGRSNWPPPAPAVPLPPNRPDEFALRTDHAPTPHVAVAALPASARAGLPAAITGDGTAAVPRVLAFAAPALGAVVRAAPAAVPLPMSRPQFVAARLDRSNFRSLTGAGFGKSPGRTGLGSSVSALRPAARASLGTMAAEASAGSARNFGPRATDLTSDRFSGAAVKPAERVSTAVLRKARAETAAD